MSEIPRRTVQRTAKLAGLPLGAAGRFAAGWGKRLTGRDADEVNAEISARTAEQLFAVLGQLKGGAMKFGQALSVFEAAVPDEYAEPYREALTKLQSAAPPMPTRDVHQVLTEQLGSAWRSRFSEFDDVPTAAASIGQVHRATWHDGREVAVKVQYPGAGEALMSDLRQLQRFSRLIQGIVPGTEVKPLLTELQERMSEELDYRVEADAQRRFVKAYTDDPNVRVPRVLASAPRALVTEWVEGTGLAGIIRDGSQDDRDHAGTLLSLFNFSAPHQAGLLHADPHPGNFMLDGDGRLIVIDFGAVARLPGGPPPTFGVLLRLALGDDPDELLRFLRAERFLGPRTELAAEDVLAFLSPLVEPLRTERFTFTRGWMQGQADRVGNLRGTDFRTSRSLNLPPEYLMIYRTTMGTTAILCQLGATVAARRIVGDWLPGFRTD
ncbi:ABC1 kinase family protein [Actinoalloteichus caeruleus]|uniref:ABC1 kinase family protein n=1 Tax=Actinoalloteichus cyanogriseus TaxID=2893586 RepID=UPI003BB93911